MSTSEDARLETEFEGFTVILQIHAVHRKDPRIETVICEPRRNPFDSEQNQSVPRSQI